MNVAMVSQAEQARAETAEPAVVIGNECRIPASAHSFASFRQWAHSDSFPETGRIDYLDGDVEVDMSPEDLFTHGAVKTAIAGVLYRLVVETDLGSLYIDRTRVTAPDAGLSVEPDLVVVLWESVELGRIRHVPAIGKGPDRYIEIEGAPDLVVEIVSDSSVTKDSERLPVRYANAGVREFWRVDARGDAVVFEILALDGERFRDLQPSSDGWLSSQVLDQRFRLSRDPGRHGSWRYRLEHAALMS